MNADPPAPAAPNAAFDPSDRRFMRLALDQAQNAALSGEVPVGAVLVQHGQVVATGYNRCITDSDPTAHAELVALRHGAHLLGNYRLPECVLYVTLEPCAMCAMALMHARLQRVVFATPDPKTGVAGSVLNLFAIKTLNHHTAIQGGLMAEVASAQLKNFFAHRRAQLKMERALRRPAAPDTDFPAHPGHEYLQPACLQDVQIWSPDELPDPIDAQEMDPGGPDHV